ncbi:hypothetical protein [Moritella dasanensis]|uniref:hypothetical protein n=1 Tax=Moritella dasanensis TaxID=428031 RepID=UPI0002F5FCCA|nr:hypothetical protein [Moritella dasanensis]
MRYKIKITKDKKPFCDVAIENNDHKTRDEILALALTRFPTTEGFTREVLFSDDEVRYLKSTPTGIEVLAVQPIYQPCNER